MADKKVLVVGHSEGLDFRINKILGSALINTETGEHLMNISPLESIPSIETDSIKNFTIQKVYDIDDSNFYGGMIKMRLVDESGIVMEGDYYHNKIKDRIEGFFEALDYFHVEYEVKTVQVNGEC